MNTAARVTPAPAMTAAQLHDTVAALLNAPNGAMLTVAEPGTSGRVLLRAALARQFHIDDLPHDQARLWVRPLTAYTADLSAFDLHTDRPWSLALRLATAWHSTVMFDGGDGRAVIEPCDEEQAWVLEFWDQWLAKRSADDQQLIAEELHRH